MMISNEVFFVLTNKLKKISHILLQGLYDLQRNKNKQEETFRKHFKDIKTMLNTADEACHKTENHNLEQLIKACLNIAYLWDTYADDIQIPKGQPSDKDIKIDIDNMLQVRERWEKKPTFEEYYLPIIQDMYNQTPMPESNKKEAKNSAEKNRLSSVIKKFKALIISHIQVLFKVEEFTVQDIPAIVSVIKHPEFISGSVTTLQLYFNLLLNDINSRDEERKENIALVRKEIAQSKDCTFALRKLEVLLLAGKESSLSNDAYFQAGIVYAAIKNINSLLTKSQQSIILHKKIKIYHRLNIFRPFSDSCVDYNELHDFLDKEEGIIVSEGISFSAPGKDGIISFNEENISLETWYELEEAAADLLVNDMLIKNYYNQNMKRIQIYILNTIKSLEEIKNIPPSILPQSSIEQTPPIEEDLNPIEKNLIDNPADQNLNSSCLPTSFATSGSIRFFEASSMDKSSPNLLGTDKTMETFYDDFFGL